MPSSLTRCAVAFVVFLSVPTVAQAPPWTLTFDEDPVDRAPSGFTLAAMRQSDAGRWVVQRTDVGGHLVHRADPKAPGFALAVADRSVPEDMAVSARLKFNGTSRVGGIVWHYVDDHNYHALLLDLDQGALSVYRITAGNRVRLDMKDELELDPDAWHSLKVAHIGQDIRVMLGGVRVFDEHDRRGHRSGALGRVGLVSTGTSEIWFDDLIVETKRSHK